MVSGFVRQRSELPDRRRGAATLSPDKRWVVKRILNGKFLALEAPANISTSVYKMLIINRIFVETNLNIVDFMKENLEKVGCY